MKSLKADSEGADGGAEASQASSQAAPEKCCAESGTASCVEEKIDFSKPYRFVDPENPWKKRSFEGCTVRRLQEPVLIEGKRVKPPTPTMEIQ